MKALILNSGMGTRMGDITKTHPKCMTKILYNETIISMQLNSIFKARLSDVIITTGYFDNVLKDYVDSLNLPLNITYVKNPIFDKTNYIYSIYCAKEYLDDDILLMHGDLVFDYKVLIGIINANYSCMKVSSTLPIPEKDFKAVVCDNQIKSVGVEFFDNVMEAQALYKLKKDDWQIWLNEIVSFCEKGLTNCYAENAFNNVSDKCKIFAYDVKDMLCTEIDNPDDLNKVKSLINNNIIKE